MRTITLIVLVALAWPGPPAAAGGTNMTLDFFAEGRPRVFLDLTLPVVQEHCLKDPLANLRRCFQTMTGVSLPVLPAAGLVPLRLEYMSAAEDRRARDPLGLQGYVITVTADGITLSAPTTVGLGNAVYDLLDQWGCRWIMPGPLGEVIPRR